HRSISVRPSCTPGQLELPTAHASLDETTATPARTEFTPGTFGVAVSVQVVPFQRAVSVRYWQGPPERNPTAQPSAPPLTSTSWNPAPRVCDSNALQATDLVAANEPRGEVAIAEPPTRATTRPRRIRIPPVATM